MNLKTLLLAWQKAIILINNKYSNVRVMTKPLDYGLIKQAWDEDHANVKLHFPDISVPEAHAGAAHIFAIWYGRWGPHMPEHLEMEDVDSPTNALILMKPIKVYTPFNLRSMHCTFLLQDITIFLLMITCLKMGSPAKAHMNMT
jgi:hypothetical protein